MDKYTEPDYENCALLTIDTQNDFSLKGAICEIKGTYEDVIPNMVKILKRFRKKSKPIIHIIRLYKEDGSNVDICRKKKVEDGLKVVAPNSEGAELVKELKPSEVKFDTKRLLSGEIQELASNEFVIYKPRWGAFYNTPLECFLKEKGITTLVVTGCNFPNCPRTSIYEASERDFRLIIIKDAISGIYDKGIEELRKISCKLIRTEDFLKEF